MANAVFARMQVMKCDDPINPGNELSIHFFSRSSPQNQLNSNYTREIS
jgi:hypothetical protein